MLQHQLPVVEVSWFCTALAHNSVRPSLGPTLPSRSLGCARPLLASVTIAEGSECSSAATACGWVKENQDRDLALATYLLTVSGVPSFPKYNRAPDDETMHHPLQLMGPDRGTSATATLRRGLLDGCGCVAKLMTVSEGVTANCAAPDATCDTGMAQVKMREPACRNTISRPLAI